ncbi:TRAP transporter small permease [Paracoccus versutus]|uniref:TRAP transporter small permease n=1 Tax=Paracoccus versutus TaxID=34007 RepID=UPI001FB63854|nr:TRAP transporter small permease [Paracoccus versutus]MCJ1901699.1 TRAP transporter small permease [Paracoccus versutus]
MKLYDGALKGLAFLGAACLAFITIAIIADVAMRNFGLHSIQAVSSLIEYGLLFSTMAVAPYLVRTNGHVAIQSFVEKMPPPTRRAVSRFALILSVLMLALVSWRAAAVAVEVTQFGAVDMRSVNFPGWVLYVMLSAGFGLMALEFLILLMRGELFHGTQGEG